MTSRGWSVSSAAQSRKRGVRCGIRLSLFGPVSLHSVGHPAKFPSEIELLEDDGPSRPRGLSPYSTSGIGNEMRNASTAQETAEPEAQGTTFLPGPLGFVLPQRRRGGAVLRRQRPLPACGVFRLPALGATARDPRQVLHTWPRKLQARIAGRRAGAGAGQPQGRALRRRPSGRATLCIHRIHGRENARIVAAGNPNTEKKEQQAHANPGRIAGRYTKSGGIMDQERTAVDGGSLGV